MQECTCLCQMQGTHKWRRRCHCVKLPAYVICSARTQMASTMPLCPLMSYAGHTHKWRRGGHCVEVPTYIIGRARTHGVDDATVEVPAYVIGRAHTQMASTTPLCKGARLCHRQGTHTRRRRGHYVEVPAYRRNHEISVSSSPICLAVGSF